MVIKKLVLLFILVIFQGCGSGESETQHPLPSFWYRGNTHAHTIVSGHADSSPEDVAKWYYENEYDFLIISEHNHFIDPDSVELPPNSAGDFILIPGLEVTGQKNIHTTAMNVKRIIPYTFSSPLKSEIIQNQVDGIVSDGGVAILNHPNWRYAVTVEDVVPVNRLHFFELYSGTPGTNNFGADQLGDDLHSTTEEIWDDLLSQGMAIYGVASDDAHHFKKIGRRYSNPGRGWVMVKSPFLTPHDITVAMGRGEFYSSNGVMLDQCSVSSNNYNVTVNEEETVRVLRSETLYGRSVSQGEIGYEIEFIGSSGNVLFKTKSSDSSFAIDSADDYIRAKVTFRQVNSNQELEEFYAWCQPFFNDGRSVNIYTSF